MYNLILGLHILIVIVLVGIILIQRGRSGGLIEALGGVESIFGTKTSSFLVKLTVVLAILFFFTSFFLAYLSKEQGKSLIEKMKIEQAPHQSSEDKSSSEPKVNKKAQTSSHKASSPPSSSNEETTN